MDYKKSSLNTLFLYLGSSQNGLYPFCCFLNLFWKERKRDKYMDHDKRCKCEERDRDNMEVIDVQGFTRVRCRATKWISDRREPYETRFLQDIVIRFEHHARESDQVDIPEDDTVFVGESEDREW